MFYLKFKMLSLLKNNEMKTHEKKLGTQKKNWVSPMIKLINKDIIMMAKPSGNRDGGHS